MSVRDDVATAIDAWLAPYRGAVPGASLMLRQGDAVCLRSAGLADLESGAIASAHTNYRLASISKQFTAAAVLLLAERGRLALDDRARRWLPALPAWAGPISLLDLLTHRSGVPDYEDLLSAGGPQVRDADIPGLLATCPGPLFAAGSAYRYSNGGYALLARVVEQASAQDFPGFLSEHVFRPLGMTSTVARVDGGPAVPHRAYGYSHLDGAWRRTDQGPTTAVLGDGGIYSSIDDLARWDEAWQDARLLGDASRRLATTALTDTDEAGTCYGLGWRVSGDTIWHSGESLGFRNVLLRIPSRAITLAMLSNRNDPEPVGEAMAIARLLVG